MNHIASSSRRLGIVNVPEAYVLEMFLSMGDKLPDYICVPQFDLPEGTKVLSVHHEMWNRSFQFTVEHESFAEVEPGNLIPWLNAAMGERAVRVVKPTPDNLGPFNVNFNTLVRGDCQPDEPIIR